MKPGRSSLPVLVVAGLGLVVSQPAFAYVGPGAGLTAIGSVLAVLAALFLGVVGFIWYPIRRLLRKVKPASKKSSGAASDGSDSGQ